MIKFDEMEPYSFGYLGERARQTNPELVAEADRQAYASATEGGLDDVRLVEWAMSKNGRWFADAVFDGSEPDPETWPAGTPPMRTCQHATATFCEMDETDTEAPGHLRAVCDDCEMPLNMWVATCSTCQGVGVVPAAPGMVDLFGRQRSFVHCPDCNGTRVMSVDRHGR